MDGVSNTQNESIYMTVRMVNTIVNGPIHEKVGAVFVLALAVVVDIFVFIFGNITAGFLNTFVARNVARNMVNNILEDEGVQRNLAINVAGIAGNRTVAGGAADLIRRAARGNDLQNDLGSAAASIVDKFVWKIFKSRLLLGALIIGVLVLAYHMNLDLLPKGKVSDE